MIVLASASPRRKELLQKMGLEFIVHPSNYLEDHNLKLLPIDLVKELSRGKAIDVAKHYQDAIIIGGDTIVEFNGEIIGKLMNRKNAIEILTKLSGSTHRVITAYTVIDVKTGKEITRAIPSTVIFRKYTLSEIEKYVDLDKPFDKAGYAIEDPHFNLAQKIIGNRDTITGLPTKELSIDLKEFGINI